ncbi:hypothetical protein V5O39_05920 [Pseudomonas parakoreensis]
MIVACDLAHTEGLDNAEDRFTDGRANRLAVDVDSHIRLGQGLDIKGAFEAVHYDVHP